MAQSHLQTDRQNRENSGCLKVTTLYFKSQQDTNWPAWVQEGLDAADTWFRKLREGDTQDQGSKGPGSPHVQIGTKTIHAILNTKVTMPGKTENEVAEEIQVFRVEGPPPTTRDTAMKFEKSDDDMEEEPKRTPFVKITYRLNSEQARTDLTSALRLLRADIRFGTAPRTKATKQLAKLLKEIKTMRR